MQDRVTSIIVLLFLIAYQEEKNHSFFQLLIHTGTSTKTAQYYLKLASDADTRSRKQVSL